MIPKPLDEIVEADIDQLKAAGIQEGKTLEYKRELPSTRDVRIPGDVNKAFR